MAEELEEESYTVPYANPKQRISEWTKLFAAANIRSDFDTMRYAKMHIDLYSAKTEADHRRWEFEVVSYWLERLKYRPKFEQAIGLQSITTESAEAWDNTVKEMLDFVSKPASESKGGSDVQS